MENNVFEYNKETWKVVYDENILPSEHCSKCEFTHLCDKYIDDKEWFACGCTFHADKFYIKKL